MQEDGNSKDKKEKKMDGEKQAGLQYMYLAKAVTEGAGNTIKLLPHQSVL